MSNNDYEDFEEQNAQSTFDVDVKQAVAQQVKEIDCEGKNSFGANEKIVFKIDPNNVPYFDSRSCYFTWDLEMTNGVGQPSYVLPNALAGAGAGFVQTMTTRSGDGNVLSQIPQYNVFHSTLHPHTCNDSNGGVRALQDFSFGASRGESGDGNVGYSLTNNPFWVVSNTTTGARTNQKVKVCWRPYNGLLNNYGHSSKVVPNVMMGGLQVELETEAVERCLFPPQVQIKNLRKDLYYGADKIEVWGNGGINVGATLTTFRVEQTGDRSIITNTDTPIAPGVGGTGYAVADNVALTGGTGSGAKINIMSVVAGAVATYCFAHDGRGVGYTAGDVLTISGGGADAKITLAIGDVNDEGSVGTASSKAIFKVNDTCDFYGNVGAGIVNLGAQTITGVSTNDTDGDVVYTLNPGVALVGGTKLTDASMRALSSAYTGMTYTLSNPRLVLRQLVLDGQQQGALMRSLKRGDGSVGYEYVDIAQVKKSVNRNELVSQMDIPTLSTRCLALVSQPQDNSALNDNFNYGVIKNAYNDESSYQYLIHQRLQPNRKVDVDAIEGQPLHIYELTKSLQQSGVDVQRNKSRNLDWTYASNNLKQSMNFKVGRAIGEWSNSVDCSSDGSLALVVNYSQVGRSFDELWTHYLFHKKIVMNSKEGVRVSY